MGSMNKEDSFKLLDAFVAAGGNFIDTAVSFWIPAIHPTNRPDRNDRSSNPLQNNYQNEESEKWIGEWLTERGIRDQIVLATKFTTPYRSYELGKAETVNFAGNHKKSLRLSVRDSLKKMQTEYIDLLYLHWWVSEKTYLEATQPGLITTEPIVM